MALKDFKLFSLIQKSKKNSPITMAELGQTVLLDLNASINNLNVTITHADGMFNYVATASGGTSPYTYLWTVTSVGSIGGTDIAISSGSTTATCVTNSNPGMMRCQVTDANGNIVSGYFTQLTPGA